MFKPLYEHDTIVYNAVEQITKILKKHNIEQTIEYNNNRVDITYYSENTLGAYDIIILDYSEDEINEMQDEAGNYMFANQDECITIDFWRNEMKICQFYGNWLQMFLELLETTL